MPLNGCWYMKSKDVNSKHHKSIYTVHIYHTKPNLAMQPDGKDFKWEMSHLYLERFYFEGFLDHLSDEEPGTGPN